MKHRAGFVLPLMRGGLWLTLCVLVPASSLWAGGVSTISASNGEGLSGVQLASPPATCTAVSNTSMGNCSVRGEAAVGATAAGAFFSDASWSDSREYLLNFFTETQISRLLTSNVGRSWVTAPCWTPECGQLLKGNVVSPGEILAEGLSLPEGRDRLISDQFSWGATSLVPNLGDLGFFGNGGAAPAGLTRQLVHAALGSAVTNTDPTNPNRGLCDGKITNPACSDGLIDDPLNQSATQPATLKPWDARVWGHCDPDRIFLRLSVTRAQVIANPPSPIVQPFIEMAQKTLDACLFHIAATPLTSPFGDAVLDPTRDPLDMTDPLNDRTYDMYQTKNDFVQADHPDIQSYYQSNYVGAGFLDPIPAETNPNLSRTRQIRYFNDWQLKQGDFDPNVYKNAEGLSMVAGNLVASMPSKEDAYAYAFIVQTRNVNPQRDCATSNDANCIQGSTNSTTDPFWGEQIVRNPNGTLKRDPMTNRLIEDYASQYVVGTTAVPFGVISGDGTSNVHKASGMGSLDLPPSGIPGSEEGLKFLLAQSVEGYLMSCLNCDSLVSGASHPFQPAMPPLEFQPYTAMWHTVPSISVGSHPATPVLQ